MLTTWTPAHMPEKEEIKIRLQTARSQLYDFQMKIKEHKIPVIVLFEGWGSSGKGSTIGKVIKNIDPRFFKVATMSAPTAEELRYSQSAVSQAVRTLEHETETVLIDRKKDGIGLTADGEQYLPYFQQIYQAEKNLERKEEEMKGLTNSAIRIGTFTSVSRTFLPRLMMEFKKQYPEVRFILQQGEYTSIAQWVRDGNVDFGFANAEAVPGLETSILYKDEMAAVLPKGHPLTGKQVISLKDLEHEPFILLDEGEYSVPEQAFRRAGLHPKIEYKVYDDYSILAMVRQSLGVSAMYKRVLEGFEAGLAVRPVKERMERPVALVWKDWNTMPFAARKFVSYVRLKF